MHPLECKHDIIEILNNKPITNFICNLIFKILINKAIRNIRPASGYWGHPFLVVDKNKRKTGKNNWGFSKIGVSDLFVWLFKLCGGWWLFSAKAKVLFAAMLLGQLLGKWIVDIHKYNQPVSLYFFPTHIKSFFGITVIIDIVGVWLRS